jgi:glycosyl-4,4'-diaponeurosporenoate acyltransferase
MVATLTVDAVVWVVWCVAVGWYQARRPLSALVEPGPVTRLRGFERGGSWHQRWFRVRAWKDHLPEAGTWFGGVSKSHLPVGERHAALDRFAAESLRAERTHWTIVAITPLFALWNPPELFLVNVVFALLVNAACIVVPRYNRARIAAFGRAAR